MYVPRCVTASRQSMPALWTSAAQSAFVACASPLFAAVGGVRSRHSRMWVPLFAVDGTRTTTQLGKAAGFVAGVDQLSFSDDIGWTCSRSPLSWMKSMTIGQNLSGASNQVK
jgi:hypothetical protein